MSINEASEAVTKPDLRNGACVTHDSQLGSRRSFAEEVDPSPYFLSSIGLGCDLADELSVVVSLEPDHNHDVSAHLHCDYDFHRASVGFASEIGLCCSAFHPFWRTGRSCDRCSFGSLHGDDQSNELTHDPCFGDRTPWA